MGSNSKQVDGCGPMHSLLEQKFVNKLVSWGPFSWRTSNTLSPKSLYSPASLWSKTALNIGVVGGAGQPTNKKTTFLLCF